MKKLASLFVLFSMLSCLTPPTKTPLKGTYQPVKTFVINKPIEEVWSKVIDLFAQKGFGIKIIDKTSGLIISERMDFSNNYTYENANGELVNKDAFFVIDDVKPKTNTLFVTPNIIVKSAWNIRIKEEIKGSTTISVNITDIDESHKLQYYASGQQMKIPIVAYSTGVFEKWVSDQLK